MLRVLHIAAHLGGGIGTAYYGIINETYKQGVEIVHSFLLMEDPIELSIIENLQKLGVQISIYRNQKEETQVLLSTADVVVFNWWHHPSLYRFLIEYDNVSFRAVIWSHVSGCTYPYINQKLLDLCDKLILTTPYSYENEDMASLDTALTRRKTEVVYGLGDLSNYISLEKKAHNMFNIGYVGTINFAKIHPDIEAYCAAVDIEDSIFTFVGRDDISKTLSNQSVLSKMNFVGYSRTPWNYMAQFDIFGYLLSSTHYGTTENALLEAMAAGVVPVAMKQNVERYIIENGVNGFLVESPEEYGEVLRYLYKHPDTCKKIGQCAQKSILERFSTKINTSKLNDICFEVSSLPKRKIQFVDTLGYEPFDWFLFGMDSVTQEKMLSLSQQIDSTSVLQSLPQIFFQENKSSILHYHKYYPESKELAVIHDTIKK